MLWDANLIARLLELYKENRILWDAKHNLHSDKYTKQLALQGITEELGVPVTPSDIDRKYRTMRAAYQVEIRKINAAKLRGFFYKPTLHWFDTFHRFNEETNEIKNRDAPAVPVHIINAKNVRMREQEERNRRRRGQRIVWTQSPKDSKKRLSVRVVSTESVENREPLDAEESLEESDDEFQTFADHIAVQLKTMSVHRAVMIQNQIQRLFAREREMYDDNEESI